MIIMKIIVKVKHKIAELKKINSTMFLIPKTVNKATNKPTPPADIDKILLSLSSFVLNQALTLFE